MLFEPCGDLRKDYGAFCENLRLTEREEVYSALHTTEAHTTTVEEVEKPAAATTDGGDPSGLQAGVAAATKDALTLRPGSSKPARSRQPSAARRKSGGTLERGSVTLSPDQASADAAADASASPPHTQHFPSLTYVSLRHPTFCINQRDITPLCRAMPHCPSLVSVQLTGCGLSVEAFMLLVEAVYKSRRVLTVEVDFNSLPQPGFLLDPTITAAAAANANANAAVPPTWRNGSGLSTPRVYEEMPGDGPFASACEESSVAAGAAGMHAAHNSTTTTATAGGESALGDEASRDGMQGRRASRKSSARSRRSVASSSKRMSKPALDAAAASAAAAAAAEAAAAALAAADEPGAIYLKPTEFCGLHLVPTALEELVAEERDKKGKVDPKKLAQLQAQMDAMHEFDRANRRRVPRGWHGMLYTAVRHLSLRGNSIGDDAVADMVDAILSNPFCQLTSLNLWGNSITDQGATHLARLLMSSHTLRALDVGNNALSDAGVLTLVECFRMRESTSMDELHRYRYAVLTRPSASPEERQAAALSAAYVPATNTCGGGGGLLPPLQGTASALASQGAPSSSSATSAAAAAVAAAAAAAAGAAAASPAAYPSYQDLYRVWHAARFSRVAATGGVVSSGASSITYPLTGAEAENTAAAPVAAAGSVNTTVNSSTSGARRAPGAKSKGARNEPTPPLTTLHRPTLPFDRDCLRVLPTADSAVRVPGNTVLEVLNMAGNRFVTPDGAREAARILALHEPRTDAEMMALIVGSIGAAGTDAVSPFSPPPPLNAVVEAPPAHCAGLRLRSMVVFAKRYEDGEGVWAEMAAAQRAINASLDSWAPHQQPARSESGGVIPLNTAGAGNYTSATSSCASPRAARGDTSSLVRGGGTVGKVPVR